MQKLPTAADLRACLTELDKSPSQIASQLMQLGDFRSHGTILRCLQRALSGETAISGDLFVIVQMLLRQQRRWQREEKNVEWIPDRAGDLCAELRGFRIKLHHYRDKSWQIHVFNGNYSHPFPAYPTNIESAKLKALECVEEAEAYLDSEECSMRALET